MMIIIPVNDGPPVMGGFGDAYTRPDFGSSNAISAPYRGGTYEEGGDMLHGFMGVALRADHGHVLIL